MREPISDNKNYNKISKNFLKYESLGMQPNIRIQWSKAKNYHVEDRFKKKYMDFTSGIFAVNIGHKNKNLINSTTKVLRSGIAHTYTYFNQYRENYVKNLINFINQKKLKKCHLVSSGTEATETALKLVRTYGQSINKKKIGIICIKGNWHGRTVGSQMLSGKNGQSKWIGYFDRNIFHVDFPYPWQFKDKRDLKSFFKKSLKKRFKTGYNFKRNITAILLETFQGWGAVFYPKEYIQEIKSFCAKNNILLCFDEMQSGFGRTGKKFGFEHYNVSPDLICCGKGMGSGFPLSGVITSKKVMDNKLVSGLSSTHSSNALVCAAGLTTLNEIKNKNLVKKSAELGKFFHIELNKLRKKFDKIIFQTLGKGLIASIIFKNKKNITATEIANYVSKECLLSGLLVCNTGRESIKLGPPLTIDKKGIKKAIQILDKAITKGYLL